MIYYFFFIDVVWSSFFASSVSLDMFADNRKNIEEVGTQDGAAVKEQLDAWTTHKTEAGVVYYYNALTGESTYVKPLGFKGEVFL